MIKILDTDLYRLGVIRNAISCVRMEEINGENILDFTAVLDAKMNNLIVDDTIFEVNGDYFDTALIKKSLNDDGTYTIEVESEHVSYRLNNPELDVELFTETGSPSDILEKILEDTEFSVGTVEFTDDVSYSAQEAKSRRQLLMEFVATLGGEVIFDKFEIGIVEHRGSVQIKKAIKDRNVKLISKTINRRSMDDNGNAKVSYVCTPIYMPEEGYILGDSILLMQRDLLINETLRVVRLSVNPYDDKSAIFTFANYNDGLESQLYRITSSAVIKDKLYNGTRIGPEYGFEAIRSDKLARAYFRSDGMKFQSGDGSGFMWKDLLYFEYDSEKDETKLVFGGLMHGGSIAIGGTIENPEFSVDEEGNTVARSVTLKDKLSILGQENTMVVDQWGINPSYLAYPNKVINSGFEVNDPETGGVLFWTGGRSTTSNVFEGTYCMNLLPGEILEQGMFTEVLHAGADPLWWNNLRSRVAFRLYGGTVRVRARLVDTNYAYTIYDNSGQEEIFGDYLDYVAGITWADSLKTFWYNPIEDMGRVKLSFQNVGAKSVFIDAIQHGPDLTGKWPLPYSPGPFSIPVAVGFGDISANDTEFRRKAVTHGLDSAKPIIR